MRLDKRRYYVQGHKCPTKTSLDFLKISSNGFRLPGFLARFVSKVYTFLKSASLLQSWHRPCPPCALSAIDLLLKEVSILKFVAVQKGGPQENGSSSLTSPCYWITTTPAWHNPHHVQRPRKADIGFQKSDLNMDEFAKSRGNDLCKGRRRNDRTS
jgi:hypothetical protein